MASTVVEVTSLPACDFCDDTAQFDGRTKHGFWAYMCGRCFSHNGMSLGLGVGQKLTVKGA